MSDDTWVSQQVSDRVADVLEDALAHTKTSRYDLGRFLVNIGCSLVCLHNGQTYGDVLKMQSHLEKFLETVCD